MVANHWTKDAMAPINHSSLLCALELKVQKVRCTDPIYLLFPLKWWDPICCSHCT